MRISFSVGAVSRTFSTPSRPIKIAPFPPKRKKEKRRRRSAYTTYHYNILALRRLVPICFYDEKLVMLLHWIDQCMQYQIPFILLLPSTIDTVAMKSISLDLIKYVDKTWTSSYVMLLLLSLYDLIIIFMLFDIGHSNEYNQCERNRY